MAGAAARAKAQQPLYIQIGNDGTLDGIEIYGITQDNEKKIWLTTSNGIYSFDGKDFDHYLNDGVGQNEFFQPYFTASKQLFFTSINGDIYTLKNKKISLFKFNNVPNNVSYISLSCSGNFLYFLSRDSIYQIDTNGKSKALYGYPNAFLDCDFKNFKRSPTLQFITSDFEAKVIISGSTFKVLKNSLQLDAAEIKGHKNFILVNGELKHIAVLKANSPKNFAVSGEVMIREASTHKLSQWYKCGNQNIWSCDVFKKGLYFTPAGSSRGRKIFLEFDINYIFEDIEGDIWLGTRNNGLILISNLTNYLVASSEDLIGIDHSKTDVLTYSSKSVYRYNPSQNEALEEIGNPETETIIYLFADPNREGFFLQYLGHIDYWKDETSYKSHMPYVPLIKNYHWTGDITGLFATIGGSFALDVKDGKSAKLIGPPSTRGSSLIYLKGEKKYLLACANGLLLCDENGKTERVIRLDNQIFNSKLLFQIGKKIIAVSTSGTIYEIEPKGYKIIKVAKVDLGHFKSGLILDDHTLLLTGKRKVIQYNTDSKEVIILPLHLSPEMQLSDATIFQNSIWFSSSKGMIRYQLGAPRYKSKSSLFLEISNDFGEDISSDYKFSSEENYFSFKVRCREFRYHLNNKIAYQLIGKDDHTTIVNEADGDIIFKSLLPGRYVFKVQSINPYGVTSKWLFYEFTVSKPFYQQWWFYLLLMLLTTLIILYFYRIKVIQDRKNETFDRQLKETELKAIKAQMNPHFIFNCLTSIQSLILSEDIEASNRYLGQFSSLVRKTLDYSSQQTIEIESEINLLMLYLDLEKLRFKDLNYCLKHNLEPRDLSELEVPPMLIQPYVENALKHGLLHKKGTKKLEIEIVKYESNIVFHIKDNGIGVDRAAQIKKKQSRYRSFSGVAISKRLGILNKEISKGKIEVSIHDYSKDTNMEWTTVVKVTFENIS